MKSSASEKPMHIQNVYISNIPLEWINSLKCFGIYFRSEQRANIELDCLLGRMKARLQALRRVTISKVGEGSEILRLFYIYLMILSRL